MKMPVIISIIAMVSIAIGNSSCHSNNSNINKSKNLFFKDLANISYKITDSTLSLIDNSSTINIDFIILDSAQLENSDQKMFTIGINSFSKQTPEHIKEIAALAIGNKLGAHEINIIKDRTTYEAHITSDLNGTKGKEIMKLLDESWDFHFILK